MNKKLRTPAAAVLLLITSILSLSDFVVSMIRYNETLSGSFLFLLLIAADLAICFTLFAKKYNNSLIIVLAVAALLNGIPLLINFNLFDLLYFAAYVALLVAALASCEQTLVKADMSAVKVLAGKLYFLPAALCLVANVINWIGIFAYCQPIEWIIFIFVDLLSAVAWTIVAMLSMVKWFNDPYAKTGYAPATSEGGAYMEEDYSEAYCGMGKHIVLCLFTFGIWPLIWIYRTTKYLNKAPNATYYNPTTKLLLCMFIPFYQIYWFYKHGQRLDAMSKQKQLNNSDMATLCLILGIFIPLVSCILMQDRVNVLCTTKTVKAMPQAEDTTVEQLKKYKELMDSGIISQEDYDAKKKQLLGL